MEFQPPFFPEATLKVEYAESPGASGQVGEFIPTSFTLASLPMQATPSLIDPGDVQHSATSLLAVPLQMVTMASHENQVPELPAESDSRTLEGGEFETDSSEQASQASNPMQDNGEIGDHFQTSNPGFPDMTFPSAPEPDQEIGFVPVETFGHATHAQPQENAAVVEPVAVAPFPMDTNPSPVKEERIETRKSGRETRRLVSIPKKRRRKSGADEESDDSDGDYVPGKELEPVTGRTTRSHSKAKHSRKDLALEQKIRVLEMRDEGVPQMQIAKDFGIGQSTVSKIIKEKDHILWLFDKGTRGRKRNRRSNKLDVDDALMTWYEDMLAAGEPLSLNILKAKAAELASELGMPFERNNSNWLARFVKRNNIDFGGGDVAASQSLDYGDRAPKKSNRGRPPDKDKFGKKFTETLCKYERGCVYSCYVTQIRARSIPGKGKMAQGRPWSVVLCSNFDGGFRRPALVLENGAGDVKDFLRKLNGELRRRKGKGTGVGVDEWDAAGKLLFVVGGQVGEDVGNLNLKDTEILVLPEKLEKRGVRHPISGDVITEFKIRYRKKLMSHVISLMDAAAAANDPVLPASRYAATKVDARLCRHFLSAAWFEVSWRTIEDGFRSARNDGVTPVIVPGQKLRVDPSPECRALGISEDEMSAFILSEDAGAPALNNHSNNHGGGGEDDDEEEGGGWEGWGRGGGGGSVKCGTPEVLTALETLRKFLAANGVGDRPSFYAAESEVYSLIVSKFLNHRR